MLLVSDFILAISHLHEIPKILRQSLILHYSKPKCIFDTQPETDDLAKLLTTTDQINN